MILLRIQHISSQWNLPVHAMHKYDPSMTREDDVLSDPRIGINRAAERPQQ